MSGRTLMRLADAGVIGPVVFGLTITVLTFLEYEFTIGLGWDPIHSSDVPWPSASALGPLGWLQVANFVFFGVCLISFGFGLNRGVRASGRSSWVGPVLVIVAGIAMVLLGFETEPSTSQPPPSPLRPCTAGSTPSHSSSSRWPWLLPFSSCGDG
jgi:hypothetical protein